MQDPMTGELHPIPEDDPNNAPDGWPVYTVGERVKFRGWWWTISAIRDGRLEVTPFQLARRFHYLKRFNCCDGQHAAECANYTGPSGAEIDNVMGENESLRGEIEELRKDRDQWKDNAKHLLEVLPPRKPTVRLGDCPDCQAGDGRLCARHYRQTKVGSKADDIDE